MLSCSSISTFPGAQLPATAFSSPENPVPMTLPPHNDPQRPQSKRVYSLRLMFRYVPRRACGAERPVSYGASSPLQESGLRLGESKPSCSSMPLYLDFPVRGPGVDCQLRCEAISLRQHSGLHVQESS